MVGENFLGSETVTIIRAPLVTDSRDNSVTRDWAHATSTDVTGCMVQPFRMSNKLVTEDMIEREFARQFFRIWAPAGTDVLYTDRVSWRGQDMEVWAQKGTWVDFEGNEDHVQFLGILREG